MRNPTLESMRVQQNKCYEDNEDVKKYYDEFNLIAKLILTKLRIWQKPIIVPYMETCTLAIIVCWFKPLYTRIFCNYGLAIFSKLCLNGSPRGGRSILYPNYFIFQIWGLVPLSQQRPTYLQTNFEVKRSTALSGRSTQLRWVNEHKSNAKTDAVQMDANLQEQHSDYLQIFTMKM